MRTQGASNYHQIIIPCMAQRPANPRTASFARGGPEVDERTLGRSSKQCGLLRPLPAMDLHGLRKGLPIEGSGGCRKAIVGQHGTMPFELTLMSRGVITL